MKIGRSKLPPFPETNPELLREWHQEKNSGIDPKSLSAASTKKVWWRCLKNPSHEWPAIVGNRARKGRGCPYCAGKRTIPEESVAALRPELMKEWHPTKNKNIDPHSLSLGSMKRVSWLCGAGHEWNTLLFVRTKKDKGCPYCRGFLPSEKNSLATAHPSIAAEWHPSKNLPLTPATVTRASGKKVWWQCATNPDHEWQAQVKNRTVVGSGCPRCAEESSVRRFREILFEMTQANADFLKTFAKSIALLRRLAKRQVPRQLNLQQPFYRMLYSSAITSMESYLSDAFFQRIINNEELIDRLLMTAPEFKEKKYAIADLVDWKAQSRKKISDYLLDMVWHNLPKVEALYKNVLDVSFPNDTSSIHRAVAVRHDLVHRNGRTKTGTFHKFSHSDIESLFFTIEQFIKHIDDQIRKYSNDQKIIHQRKNRA